MNQKSVIKSDLFEKLRFRYPGMTKRDIAVHKTEKGTFLIRIAKGPAGPGVDTIGCALLVFGYRRVKPEFRSTSSIKNWDAEVFPRSTK